MNLLSMRMKGKVFMGISLTCLSCTNIGLMMLENYIKLLNRNTFGIFRQDEKETKITMTERRFNPLYLIHTEDFAVPENSREGLSTCRRRASGLVQSVVFYIFLGCDMILLLIELLSKCQFFYHLFQIK